MKKRSAYINFVEIFAFLIGVLIALAITWVLYAKIFHREENIAPIEFTSRAEIPAPEKIFEDYKKSLESGEASAQFNLGNRYYEGRDVDQDYKEAFYWYKKAAEQGHAGAQFNLGCMYGRGEGVPKNHFEAIRWLNKAAMQGNADAQKLLKIIATSK